VLKLKNVTFDADYFHIHFDNSYSCVATQSAGDDNSCSLQPSSITQGIEGESNINLTHGLSVYLNASYNTSTYEGKVPAICTGSAAACAAAGPLMETVPSGLNVRQTPTDMETEGVTYQHKAWDAGFFNKRIGTFYIDSAATSSAPLLPAYHNQATIAPFDFANLFLNYTIRSGGRFDQTKVRLSFNNLFNSSAITGDTIANTPNTITLNANGTTYIDSLNTVGQTNISGADNITIMPARSITLSLIFGFSPKR
jgi:iron complex outermembrane receptor protein